MRGMHASTWTVLMRETARIEEVADIVQRASARPETDSVRWQRVIAGAEVVLRSCGRMELALRADKGKAALQGVETEQAA